MIDRTHRLPVKRQGELLAISRGNVYYHPELVSASDLALIRRIDELHLEHPFAGARHNPLKYSTPLGVAFQT
jgi:putative transposase